jgi:hypothetical protein
MAYQPSAEAVRVTELRKSDKLKEAYEYARMEFANGNREDTFMSAYTWVLHDCLKRYFNRNSRFSQDLRAFVSALSQIRLFPIKEERDDLFLKNLIKKTSSVCWNVVKQRDLENTRLLASEITKWKKGEALYTSEIARPLLIGLKSDQQGCGMMLRWLGVSANSWDLFMKMPPETIEAQSSRDDVSYTSVLWAIYDDLKQYSGDKQGRRLFLEEFIRTLSLFRIFNQRSNDAREILGYSVAKLVHIGWDCRKTKNSRAIKLLLQEAIIWPQDSAMHCSDVLLMFSKGLEGDPIEILSLVEWYGLDKFSSQDYEEKMNGDRPFPSLAQSLTSQYLKALLSNDRDGQPVASDEQREYAVEALSKLLDTNHCSSWKWESYRFGLLLIETGRCEEARMRLANIVASDTRQAWAWAAYGRAWKADSEELYEQCLFRGLAASNDIQTSLSVHEEALQVFAKKGLFGCAKSEARIIEKFRAKQEWKASKVVENAKSQGWFSSAEESSDLQEAYEELSTEAEGILAESLPWTEFYVEWENRQKGIVGIVIPGDCNMRSLENANRGIARGKLAEQLEIGKCYKGHCGPEKKSIVGPIVECPDAQISSYFISDFAGDIDLVKNFAFVRSEMGSMWVSPSLVEKLGAKQCQRVRGTRKRLFNGKEKKWEWAINSIEIDTNAPIPKTQKTLHGNLEIVRPNSGQTFGFVDGCYVSAELIKSLNGIPQGYIDEVEIEAEKSWDKKKEKWGWRATSLKIVDPLNNEATERSEYPYDDTAVDYEHVSEKYAIPIPKEWADYASAWEQEMRRDHNVNAAES